jgi:putative hydrolase
MPARSNVWVAEHLRQAADLLALQGANPFRVSAYRHAADTIGRLAVDLRDIVQPGGQAALDAIPGIGPSIATAVMEMLTTGRWGFLERLKGAADPETLFCSVPGIGPVLAHRIQQTLNLGSLEALETAAHDGRLATVPGFGVRRLTIVRAALASTLGRLTPPVRHHALEPAVAWLLDVDREYRDKAARGVLRRIAPRRFNPGGVAWLPVLHTVRAPWHFTALYSNTAQAHRLARTSDWVIIFFSHDTSPEGQCTVVTETHGPARGHRIVRGREAECMALDSAMALAEGAQNPSDQCCVGNIVGPADRDAGSSGQNAAAKVPATAT